MEKVALRHFSTKIGLDFAAKPGCKAETFFSKEDASPWLCNSYYLPATRPLQLGVDFFTGFWEAHSSVGIDIRNGIILFSADLLNQVPSTVSGERTGCDPFTPEVKVWAYVSVNMLWSNKCASADQVVSAEVPTATLYTFWRFFLRLILVWSIGLGILTSDAVWSWLKESYPATCGVLGYRLL